MKKANVLVRDSARTFDISELFFSTTDQKGIVSTCNDVFTRVAGYEPSEILGEPHNIVRHPDMPRCVFMLLWEYLLAGKSIGAYVKNLAKTGEYYWVFALASPCPDGFLSIRLKPSSKILDTIEPFYKVLLAKEGEFGADWRAGMKSSAALLNTTLVDLGFPTYDDFMIEALRSELSARRTVMKQMNVGPVSPILGTQLQLKNSLAIAFDSIDHLIKLRSGLQNQETFLVELDMQLNRVALNSGVRAAHLGDSGRSLGVIGEEIARVSRQVGEEVVTLKREVKNLSSSLKLTTFNISLALLQSEMSDDFVTKQAAAQLSEAEQLSQFGSSAKSICELLDRCSKQSVEQALLGMEQLSSTLGSFDYFLQSLTKILLTIQFAYVTGKTQAARVEGGDAFSRLLSDLRDVSNSARAELSQLGLQVRDVSLKVDQWRQGDIGSM